jgi:hypothetical protein
MMEGGSYGALPLRHWMYSRTYIYINKRHPPLRRDVRKLLRKEEEEAFISISFLFEKNKINREEINKRN